MWSETGMHQGTSRDPFFKEMTACFGCGGWTGILGGDTKFISMLDICDLSCTIRYLYLALLAYVCELSLSRKMNQYWGEHCLLCFLKLTCSLYI